MDLQARLGFHWVRALELRLAVESSAIPVSGRLRITQISPSFITSVRSELASVLACNGSIVVEGTQGFGLSLYHARKWPYRTSRDTTAHSFLGEVGLGVRDFEVVMAIRTFPIRVSGGSGPLENEVTWGDVERLSGYPHSVTELHHCDKPVAPSGPF